MEYINQLFSNHILFVAFVSWFIAQGFKALKSMIKYKRFSIKLFFGSGGFPSSHSALVMGMANAIGFQDGFNSAGFAVAICLAAIVMYDASGVRRDVGNQAELLNEIVSDLYKEPDNDKEPLKELVGHTPKQVLAGAILGIVVAYLLR